MSVTFKHTFIDKKETNLRERTASFHLKFMHQNMSLTTGKSKSVSIGPALKPGCSGFEQDRDIHKSSKMVEAVARSEGRTRIGLLSINIV